MWGAFLTEAARFSLWHYQIMMDKNGKTPARRSRWLLLCMCVLAAVQIGAALNVLQLPAETAASLSLPINIQAGLSVLWAGAFLWAAAGLWQRGPEARNRARWLLGVFMLYSVVRLALFARTDYDQQRLQFLAVAALILLVLLLFRIASSPRKRAEGNGETET
jgi:uncharacterized membrane protein YhaH (DUF805 family)